MLQRLFDRWSKSRSFTAQELSVLRLLLPAGNAYSQRLYLQAADAPEIERKPVGLNGYEAVISYVVDDSLLIECDENTESPAIAIVSSDGVPMAFSTAIMRGGFLRGLRGQTTDGTPWTRRWAVDVQDVKIPDAVSTWVPDPMPDSARDRTLVRLCAWCGIPEKAESLRDRNVIRVSAPATERDINACEARLRIRLSPQYRELVSITNGLGIMGGRPYEVLGTADVDYVHDGWLCLTPLYEEGCVAIRCNSGTALDECFVLTLGGDRDNVGDIRQHVCESLRRNRR